MKTKLVCMTVFLVKQEKSSPNHNVTNTKLINQILKIVTKNIQRLPETWGK